MSEDYGFNDKTKPQMKAPRVTPLEGVSTYAPQGIRVRGVENPQGFGIDERRYGVDLCGSLGKGMLAKEKIGTLGNSSGLTPLNFDIKPQINADKRRYSPQRTLRTQSPGLTNFGYKGE